VKILHRHTGNTIFEFESNSIKELIEEAIKQNIDLRFATFRVVDGKQWDISGIDWKGKNLENIDLRYVIAHNSNFEGCNLSRANLCKGDFTGSNFQLCNLKLAMLTPACVKDCDFTYANWDGMRAEFTDFSNTKGYY